MYGPKFVVIKKVSFGRRYMKDNWFLESLLKPLRSFLEVENLKEISILQEKEIGLEIDGKGYIFLKAPELDYNYWKILCHSLANVNGILFNPNFHPILSTILYDPKTGYKHRFEAMLGPCVEEELSISIRLQRKDPKTLEDFGVEGELKETILSFINFQKSIIISGGTSSGKTTLLNLLAQNIPLHKRILSIEDARELSLPHKNWKAYCIPRYEEKTSSTYQSIIDHFMRARPDIILSGEISILNSFPILRLLNTGHQGFMCTIHANTPHLAIEEAFPQNLHLAGYTFSGVSDFLKKTIDLILHVDSETSGKKIIKEIWTRESSTLRNLL